MRSSCFTAAYKKYASFLMISHALHLSIFEQPSPIDFFNTLLDYKQTENFNFYIIHFYAVDET